MVLRWAAVEQCLCSSPRLCGWYDWEGACVEVPPCDTELCWESPPVPFPLPQDSPPASESSMFPPLLQPAPQPFRNLRKNISIRR